MKHLSTAVALALLGSGSLVAENPSIQRGYQAAKIYQFDDVDSVNLLNGNLQMVLPLGGRYPVSSSLTHGLTLAYNSKVWDFATRQLNFQEPHVVGEAIPNPVSNAGTGWQVSLGRLLMPGEIQATGEPGLWTYVSPDGGQHAFYAVLNAWDGQALAVPVSGLAYTRDGTYLRLHHLTATSKAVAFPNGEIHYFQPQASHGGQWLPVEIRNQFGESPSARRVMVSYGPNLWTIRDGFREQRVVFEADPNHGRRVKSLELAAFGGAAATYGFVYEETAVAKPCTDLSPFGGPTRAVTLLTRVDLPLGLQWRFEYVRDNPSPCDAAGMVSRMTVPLRGTIEWTYRPYVLPIPGCGVEAWFQSTAGVATRTLRDTTGFVGIWTYEPKTRRMNGEEFPPTPTSQSCPLRDGETGTPRLAWAPPEEMTNKVVTPLGDATIHYFSINPQVQTGPGPHNDLLDYGLPFTRRVANQADGVMRFLSSHTFECAGGADCTHVRSRYVAYERDRPLDPGNCGSPEQDFREECSDLQQRMSSELTLYVDDGSRWRSASHSDFDGLGHYRTATRRSNFPDSGQPRLETTEFNPGRGRYALDPATGQPAAGHTFSMLPSSARWLLDLYPRRTWQEGPSLLEERTCFDPATGFLSGLRTLKQPPGLRATDLLVTYARDVDGNVTAERFFGADKGTPLGVSEGAPCAAPAADQYRIDHTYQAGVRATSQYAGVPVKVLDLDVDSASGLARVSRDVSGLPTALEYDALGRLAWVMPGASPAPPADYDAWTEFVYDVPGAAATCRPAGLGGAGTAICTRVRASGSKAGAVLAESHVVYDGLGRMVRERRRLPGANLWNERLTAYNGMSWQASVSELVAAGGAAPVTRYEDYDAFGRARRVVHADGQVTKVIYGGDRTATTVIDDSGPGRGIVTGFDASGAPQYDTTQRTEVYDHLGRLVRVTEASDPDPATRDWPVRTWYSYDAAGRLTQVRTDRDGASGLPSIPAQIRSFTYDGRGFLQAENHPEKSANTFGAGNDVDYAEYDARGHAGRRIDGTTDLKFVYDRAERLRNVALTGPGSTLGTILKSFVYADANGPGNWRLGKLERSSRTNFGLVGGQTYTVEVIQEYLYGGRSGRTSNRNLRISTNGNVGESFVQSLVYDDLGNVRRVHYPECTFQPCSASGLPARQVDFSFDQGLLTAIPGFATSVTYHPNLLVHRVTHANGMTWTQDNDPASMPRPARITVSSPFITAAIGPYTYDGAGNLVKAGIGTASEQYSYDLVGRVTRGRLTNGDFQAYTYDWFGNIQQISTSIGGSTSILATATSSATNRLSAAFYNDPRGNLTWWNGNSYEYDAFNQMKRLLTAGGEEWLYFYDADDERVYQFSPGNAVRPRFDRWTLRGLDGQVLRTFEATGFADFTIGKEYVRRGASLLASWSPAEGVRHFALDHLGSPRIASGASGQSVGTHHYFPFGQEAFASGDQEPMKFTGHERDLLGTSSPADDLDYMHARHYNPLVGRFLSPDALDGISGVPQSWNRYAYARDNPVNNTDPTGSYVCEGDPECKSEDALAFEGARQRSLSSKEQGVAATALVYGNPGEANGITVLFQAPEGGVPAETRPGLAAGPEGVGMGFLGTVTVRPGLRGIDLEAAVAHEGQHLLDARGFRDSFRTDLSWWDVSKNLTKRQTETNAYRISHLVYQAAGLRASQASCGSRCEIGAGVRPADVERAINRILTDPKGPYHGRLDERQFGDFPPPP